MLCGLVRYSCIHEAHTSPALNGSSAIRRFKHSGAIKICDGITFDFYIGLPHIHTYLPTYVHKYMHKYIHTYIHTYTHTYIHTYIHTYRHTYSIHTYLQHTYIHVHVHTTINGIIMVGYVFLNFGNVVRDIINNMHVQIIRS